MARQRLSVPASSGAWRHDASVVIDYEDFLQGRVERREVLQGIRDKPGRVQQMQRTIGDNAAQLVYAINTGKQAAGDDALDITLRGLSTWVHQSSSPGATA